MSDTELEIGGHLAVNEDISDLGLRSEDQSRDSYSLSDFIITREVDMVEPFVQNMINESASAFSLSPQKELSDDNIAFSLSPQKELSDDNIMGSIEMNLENNGCKRKEFYGLISDTVNPDIKTDTFMRYAHGFLSDLDVVPTMQDLAEMDIVGPTDTLMPISSSEKTENTDVDHVTQNVQHTISDDEIPVANNEVVIGCDNVHTNESDSHLSQTEAQCKSLLDENMSTDITPTEENVNSENCELNSDRGTKRKVIDDHKFDTDDTATNFDNDFFEKNKIDSVSHMAQQIVKKPRLSEPEAEIASISVSVKENNEKAFEYSKIEFMYDDIPLATLLRMFPDGKIKYPIIRCNDVRNNKDFVEVEGTFIVHEQRETGKTVSKLSDVDNQNIQRRTRNQNLYKKYNHTPVVALRTQKEVIMKSKKRAALRKKARRTTIAARTYLKNVTTETVDSGSVELEKQDATTQPIVSVTQEVPVSEPSYCSGVSYREPDLGGTGDIGTGLGEGDLSRIGNVNLHAPIPVSRLLPSYTNNDPYDFSKPPCWLQRFLDETKRREEWKMRHLITFQRDFICLETERIVKLEKIFRAVLRPQELV